MEKRFTCSIKGVKTLSDYSMHNHSVLSKRRYNFINDRNSIIKIAFTIHIKDFDCPTMTLCCTLALRTQMTLCLQ